MAVLQEVLGLAREVKLASVHLEDACTSVVMVIFSLLVELSRGLGNFGGNSSCACLDFLERLLSLDSQVRVDKGVTGCHGAHATWVVWHLILANPKRFAQCL